MSDLQTLPAAMRPTQRYVVFEIVSDDPVEFGAVVEAIWDAVLAVLGEAGASALDVWVMKDQYNLDRQRGIIRVRHTEVTALRASLCLIEEINGQPVVVQVLAVTGTVDSAEDRIVLD